jgi:ectoine hydroxylase-related dioxygenase (phytanoyl-CoA dioxygenase family)
MERDVAPNGKVRYLAEKAVSEKQILKWVEQFNKEGFLFIPDVLPPDWCSALRADLEDALENNPNGLNGISESTRLSHRLFETSDSNLKLFDLEPIVSLAEALVTTDCHVIHNNSFQSPPGGGIIRWHQDDTPHYLVTHGEAPINISLPALFFSANYYLTDVTEIDNGGTEVVPRSHLFGRPCPEVLEGTEWEDKVHYNLGKAGSVVLFNNQVWHRGGPNRSQRTRYMTQVTYGRRMIGHKYYPFMNYEMPDHVYKGANSRLKRLLGFLPHGAYG